VLARFVVLVLALGGLAVLEPYAFVARLIGRPSQSTAGFFAGFFLVVAFLVVTM